MKAYNNLSLNSANYRERVFFCVFVLSNFTRVHFFYTSVMITSAVGNFSLSFYIGCKFWSEARLAKNICCKYFANICCRENVENSWEGRHYWKWHMVRLSRCTIPGNTLLDDVLCVETHCWKYICWGRI